CTCLVIGRVTPGGENVAPDRALNRVDFPLPVPPARATTVWLPDRRSRSPGPGGPGRSGPARRAPPGAGTGCAPPSAAAPARGACSSGRLERVLRLVQPDRGDRVNRPGRVDDLAEPEHLLVKQQRYPLAQVVPGPHDQFAGLGVPDDRGQHFPGHLADPVLAFLGALPGSRGERADR